MIRRSPLPRKRAAEKDFRDQVVQLAETLGWRCFYVTESTRIIKTHGSYRRIRNINEHGQGFPDLTMVRARDGRLIFAELKRDLGPRGGGKDVTPTPEQAEWSADLGVVAANVNVAGSAAGVSVFLWRPADFDIIAGALR